MSKRTKRSLTKTLGKPKQGHYPKEHGDPERLPREAKGRKEEEGMPLALTGVLGFKSQL